MGAVLVAAVSRRWEGGEGTVVVVVALWLPGGHVGIGVGGGTVTDCGLALALLL
jgi:hypothetical protein